MTIDEMATVDKVSIHIEQKIIVTWRDQLIERYSGYERINNVMPAANNIINPYFGIMGDSIDKLLLVKGVSVSSNPIASHPVAMLMIVDQRILESP